MEINLRVGLDDVGHCERWVVVVKWLGHFRKLASLRRSNQSARGPHVVFTARALLYRVIFIRPLCHCPVGGAVASYSKSTVPCTVPSTFNLPDGRKEIVAESGLEIRTGSALHRPTAHATSPLKHFTPFVHSTTSSPVHTIE